MTHRVTEQDATAQPRRAASATPSKVSHLFVLRSAEQFASQAQRLVPESDITLHGNRPAERSNELRHDGEGRVVIESRLIEPAFDVLFHRSVGLSQIEDIRSDRSELVCMTVA